MSFFNRLTALIAILAMLGPMVPLEAWTRKGDKYLADGEKGFVKLKRLTSADIIDLIHQSGGICVIAHPKRLREPEHLEEICKLGADGVEVVHPTATPDDEQQLYAFADERGIVATGGSDFHAPETHPPLGVRFAKDRVDRFLERVAAIA